MNITYNWKENISRWDEAVPLGNGKCGCLCWGSPEEIRFSLDRTDLCERTVLWEQNKEFSWKNLVKLAKAGNTGNIREIFDAPCCMSAYLRYPHGSWIRTLPGDYAGR